MKQYIYLSSEFSDESSSIKILSNSPCISFILSSTINEDFLLFSKCLNCWVTFEFLFKLK